MFCYYHIKREFYFFWNMWCFKMTCTRSDTLLSYFQQMIKLFFFSSSFFFQIRNYWPYPFLASLGSLSEGWFRFWHTLLLKKKKSNIILNKLILSGVCEHVFFFVLPSCTKLIFWKSHRDVATPFLIRRATNMVN